MPAGRRPRSLRTWLIKRGTAATLELTAALAKAGPPWQQRATATIRAFGALAARLRGINRGDAASPERLGATWQRAFPAKKQVPIVSVDATTAYGEIHTRCPLRGSGDVEACHRMMAYDRAFMERAGGRFVVLRSQAEPGVTVCQVAIRAASLPADDLVPAVERAGRPTKP
ncbi:MAG: hypothetical protein JST54_09320 [Deltaproteobacteria bacterium]|nr:hypothetical protein [Deltaproteobacteria bacterium]